MSKDKFQDKYNDLFQQFKEEKMNWSFDDFLEKVDQKTDSKAEITPFETKNISLPKWFWLAASLVLIVGIGAFYVQPKKEVNKDWLVKNEILKQKSEFINENAEVSKQVAILSTDSLAGNKKDSIFEENTLAEKDVLEDLLSKRARIKKEIKPKYVENTSTKDSTQYKDSYVVVNGKKITNEKEAVDVAKYSLMILRDRFRNTVATSQNNQNEDNDY